MGVATLAFAALGFTAAQAQAQEFIVDPIAAAETSLSNGNRNAGVTIGAAGNFGLSDATIVETGDPIPTTWPSHTTQGAARHWNSASGNTVGEVLSYDLDQSYELTGLHYWNDNTDDGAPANPDRSIENVTLSFSSDGGTTIDATITETFLQGPVKGNANYTGETITFASNQNANWVSITVDSMHDSSSDFASLGEVRFTAIPEPSSYAAIGGLLALGAVMCRRRHS